MSCKMRFALLILLIIFIIPVNVVADAGPKPSLSIYVKNYESQNYYLDLLVQGDESFYQALNLNYSEEYRELPLYKYREDNWMAKHIRYHLLFGDLNGKYDDKTNMMVHYFSYHGVPQTFKIIMQKEDGQLFVSDVINTKHFTATVIFDAKTGEFQEVRSLHANFLGNFPSLIRTVLVCLVLTLLIEFLIAIPFKIRPFRTVIIVNILSQAFLHSLLISSFYLKLYTYMNIIFLISEVIVFLMEYALYKKFILNTDKKKLWNYVLTANLSTFIIGLMIQI